MVVGPPPWCAVCARLLLSQSKQSVSFGSPPASSWRAADTPVVHAQQLASPELPGRNSRYKICPVAITGSVKTDGICQRNWSALHLGSGNVDQERIVISRCDGA